MHRFFARLSRMTARRLAACAGLAVALAATPASAQRFETAATQAILIDVETGSTLFEKAADDPFAPGSMTKLMTARVVLDRIAAGKLSYDDEIVISEHVWRKGGAPSGNSTMFAALKSRVSIRDLLSGLVVHAANDAALALAERVAGTEDAFTQAMNERARELLLTKSTFRNATGYPDPEQKTTARDLARLAMGLIGDHAEFYPVFAQRDFLWNKIKQPTRNPLLAMNIGADGLAVGMGADASFGIVGSAVQNGQRLLVVVNGLKTAQDRATEARKLLDWGFRGFERRLVFSGGVIVGEANVYGGEPSVVGLVAKGEVRLLVPRGAQERIDARIVYRGPLIPPVREGAEVARLRISRGATEALDVPLYAATEAHAGGLRRRAVDAAVEYGRGLFRRLIGARS